MCKLRVRQAFVSQGLAAFFCLPAEPTTGLHFDDIQKLLTSFRRLLKAGASIVVIEHNLDVIRTADWIIDLGPEGGSNGGQIVAVGPPEAIKQAPDSHTGRFLAQSPDKA
jgi:excinuclease ABC subunit A